MDKVITTALLTMAAVVAAVMVINTMIPVLGRSGSSVLLASAAASDRIKTDIEIIAVATVTSTVQVWIKNIGSVDVGDIQNSDVFLETSIDFTRMDYSASSSANTWRYELEGSATTWKPGNTLHVTITLGSPATGDNVVRFTTNNGDTDDESFST